MTENLGNAAPPAWPYHLEQVRSSVTHFPERDATGKGAQTLGPACHEPPGRRRQQRVAGRIQCSEGGGRDTM